VSIPKDLHEFLLQPSASKEDQDFTKQSPTNIRLYFPDIRTFGVGVRNTNK
jgi:hypothetical protein